MASLWIRLQEVRDAQLPWDTCAWDISRTRETSAAMFRWIRTRGIPWNTGVPAELAKRGNLYMLSWAMENGCPWDSRVILLAARNGHINVIQWIKGWCMEEGIPCPWDTRACTFAAAGGFLEILQWLRRLGCPWTSRVCFWAVQNGHLETLEWARRQGCAWDSEARIQDPHIAVYVMRENLPFKAMDIGHDTLKRLILEHGVFPRGMCSVCFSMKERSRDLCVECSRATRTGLLKAHPRISESACSIVVAYSSRG